MKILGAPTHCATLPREVSDRPANWAFLLRDVLDRPTDWATLLREVLGRPTDWITLLRKVWDRLTDKATLLRKVLRMTTYWGILPMRVLGTATDWEPSTGGDTGHANRLSYSNEAGARQANGSRITLQERDRTCYHIYSDENADEDVSQRVVPHHQGYGGQPFNLSVQETGLPGISCVMPPRHSPISDDQINAVSSTNQNKRAIQYDCSVQELTLWNQKLNGQVSFLLHCISLFEISLFCAGLHVPVFQAGRMCMKVLTLPFPLPTPPPPPPCHWIDYPRWS